MKQRRILILIMVGFLPAVAQAGVFELGAGYSYQHNAYNGGSFTTENSWNSSLGYYFTADSEVQFTYQDTVNHQVVPNVQDITYRDRVYSINFLYHLFEERSPIRPFLRMGVGQLNRDATGTYGGGLSPPGRLDQVTVVGGAGLKMKLSSRFGIKVEATSYLIGGAVSTWKDNLAINVGGSFYF